MVVDDGTCAFNRSKDTCEAWCPMTTRSTLLPVTQPMIHDAWNHSQDVLGLIKQKYKHVHRKSDFTDHWFMHHMSHFVTLSSFVLLLCCPTPAFPSPYQWWISAPLNSPLLSSPPYISVGWLVLVGAECLATCDFLWWGTGGCWLGSMESDTIVTLHFSYPQLSLYQLFDTILSQQTLFLFVHSISDFIIEIYNYLILGYTIVILVSPHNSCTQIPTPRQWMM